MIKQPCENIHSRGADVAGMYQRFERVARFDNILVTGTRSFWGFLQCNQTHHW